MPATTNFMLVMADDRGWGQTGYSGHPRIEPETVGGLRGSRGVSTRAAFAFRRSSNSPPESRSPGSRSSRLRRWTPC